MIVQKYGLFPRIQKLKKHLFSQDIVEYIIGSFLKIFVLIITGLQFYHYYDVIDE